MALRVHQTTAVTLLISVGLHAAALSIALQRGDPYQPPPDRKPMTLVEFEVQQKEKVEEPPVPEQPKPKPRVAPTRIPQNREAEEPRMPTPVASDVPRSDEPSAEPPPRPSLIPRGSFVLSLDAGVLAQTDESGLRAPEVPKDLVGELMRETLGRGKVERGLVHPYYAQLGKALTKTWNADRVLSSKGGLAGYTEQLGQNTKIFNEIWLEKASQYGATGAPIDAPVSNDNASRRTATITNAIGGISGVDLEARKEVARQMREQFKTTRRATIRVTQDSAGKLLKVELISPSNDSTVDKEALADVRSAAERLPAPPPEALQGRNQLVSTWAFELVVSITPPIPTFTFEFDEALGFIDARLPLDRRIYKKVRLMSVD